MQNFCVNFSYRLLENTLDLLLSKLAIPYLLETMKPGPTIPHLKLLLEDSVLWLSVFQLTSESSKFKDNNILHVIKNKYIHTAELFRKHLLRVSDTRMIESELENDSSGLKRLFNFFEAKFENGDKISTDKLADNLNDIDDVLAFFRRILLSSQICLSDFEEKEAALETHKRKWDEYTVSELLSEDFWLPLKNIQDKASRLLPLKDSMVFANICLKALFTRGGFGTRRMSTDDAAELFSEEASKLFFMTTGKLLRDDDIKLSCMNELFEGRLDDIENIKVELQILSGIHRVEVNNSLIKKCQNFLGIKALKDVIENLSELMEFWNVTHKDKDPLWEHMQSLRGSPEDVDSWSLNYASKVSEEINNVINCANSHFGDVIKVLSESKQLVTFLKEAIDEDIRNLIDAVEEHSDQYVTEATVSDLIDVHGCLKNLIKCMNCDFQKFLKEISELCNGDIASTLKKMENCRAHVHSLRALYLNVANRGEATMEIIDNALKHGKFLLDANGSSHSNCEITIKRQDRPVTYNEDDIQNLRSRALLLMNAVKTNSYGKKRILEGFIDQAGLIIEIRTMMNKLRKSGHFRYRKFEKEIESFEELQDLKEHLQSDLEDWTYCLEEARRKYYYLNYFYGDQLWTLFDYFMGKNPDVSDSVLNMFRFALSNFELDYLNNLTCDLQLVSEPSDLNKIGAALQTIFEPFREQKRELKGNLKGHPVTNLVRPGEVLVAALNEKSTESKNVMLSLYKNTTGLYPEPSQIYFCSPETNWEEVYLLLLRCFYAPFSGREGCLYCIANLEVLDNETQFKLIDTLHDLRKNAAQSDQKDKGPSFLLALICRGKFSDLIREQVSTTGPTKCCQISGTFDTEIAECFKNMQESVSLVTSATSGLGKSEFVCKDAAKRGFRPTTVNISGFMTKTDIMCKVSGFVISSFSCLHLNIAEINDVDTLDDFLFQLLITGAIAVGTQIYIMPSNIVYIEIANTPNNELFDALSVTKYLKFCRHHLQWENYERFVVSQEMGSPVQIVCHYLSVFDKGLLDTSEPLPNNAILLPPPRCRYLLQKYFPATSFGLSYSTVNIFLNVLSQQLKKMSASTFFNVINLQLMLGKEQCDVRSKLFQILKDVSKAFASNSLRQTEGNSDSSITREDICMAVDNGKASAASSGSQFVQQMQHLIRWEDDNHLTVVFHAANSNSLTALYRDSSLIPPTVRTLLASQKMNADTLDEFHKMSHDELLQTLKLIACEDQTVPPDLPLPTSYALTPDNILKMVLIVLRVRARVPVVIVGETGCGKTSLIRYLSQVCKVELRVFSFHAGIRQEKIICFIEKAIEDAEENLGERNLWIFLDEINTCDHISFLSDMICRRKLGPVSLPPNLSLLAACNPYRLRNDNQVLTAGLPMRNAGAKKQLKDEYSRLVYRVNQLPESLLNYIWDYGSLGVNDEKAYIERMLDETHFSNKVKLMTELIFTSHEFLRKEQNNPFCVSLRDVNRYRILVQWFCHEIRERLALQKHLSGETGKWNQTALQFDVSTRAIILALAHCYQSRISDSGKRSDYQMKMVSIFQNFDLAGDEYPKFYDQFDSIVRAEQEDYLNRMNIPEGVAKNDALLENVFVLLVCILNRIPVFIVGKPGSSKSLAVQLIRSNLRGRDSEDEYFKKLPQLYIVSYQGSESSTSDGIEKVFQKAMKYKDQANVLAVVLLDEIGLAEVSPHNPLKVLHGLLEPEKGNLPEVSVVGISNWALDPAKMNRAIYLSRPELSADDLYQTGVSIFSSICKDHVAHKPAQMYLKNIADAYFEYYTTQIFKNFHGLRDYYSLVKCFANIVLQMSGTNTSEDKLKNLMRKSFERNFGGISRGSNAIGDLFIKRSFITHSVSDTPVLDLIKDNLDDRESRHLMLITKGDSAIGILKQVLEDSNREFVSICGSRLEEDISENYQYRILSRIILHMERPCILILKDLDEIYGSLYDMLNKNYIVVGKKKNCRVAVGPFNSPMCHVHDDFRCVVIVDEENVPYSDPPFLNRFEKQMLRYSDVLNADQERLISTLMSWVTSVSCIQGDTKDFDEGSLFVGYSEETLPSLVLWHAKTDPTIAGDVLIDKCKHNLLQIATVDGIMRLKRSPLGVKNPKRAKSIASAYFDLPLQRGLKFLLQTLMKETTNTVLMPKVDQKGLLLLVLTHDHFYTSLSDLESEFLIQAERLGAFKSESQLSKRVENFFASSEELFILLCDLKHDIDNILLAKSILENQRINYLQHGKSAKHLCVVLHVHRQKEKDAPLFSSFAGNFLCGWIQVLLDSIETPQTAIPDLLHSSQEELVLNAITFKEILSNQLFWAFSCLRYCGEQRSIQEICKLIEDILACSHIVALFCDIAKQVIGHSEISEDTWLEVCAFDKPKLLTHRTYVCALENHILEVAKKLIGKLVCRLEQESLWPHRSLNDEALSFWRSVIARSDVLKLNERPPLAGLECYPVSGRLFDLMFPCSMLFINRMKENKWLFKEQTFIHIMDCNAGDLLELIRCYPIKARELLDILTCIVSRTLHELTASTLCCKMGNYFIEDVLDVFTSHLQLYLPRKERVKILKHFIFSLFRDFEQKDFDSKVAILYALIWNQGELLVSLVSMFSAYEEHRSPESHTLSGLEKLYLGTGDRFQVTDATEHRVTGGGWPGSKSDTTQYPNNVNLSSGKSDRLLVSEHEDDCEEQPGNVDIEDKDEEPEASTFEYSVVSLATQALFPLSSVIQGFKSHEHWENHSRKILNIALKIDPFPPNFHFLRLSIDFLRILTKQTDVDLNILFNLAELGVDSGKNCMESDTVLKFMVNTRKTLEIQGAKDLDELLGRYFGRCLDANPDNRLLPEIVRCLAQGDPPMSFSQMGPIVLRVLMAEEEDPPSVFKELIVDPIKVFSQHPCLETVNNEMKKNPSTFSDLEIICCDHIQILSFQQIDVLAIRSSDNSMMKLFEKALDNCTNFNIMEKKHFDLKFITSIAFLRQFLSLVAKAIKEKPCISLNPGQLFTQLNAMIKLPKGSMINKLILDYMQRHLIKSIMKWLPLYDAYKVISTLFPSLDERDDVNQLGEKLLFNWLVNAENQNQLEAAVMKFSNQNDTDLNETIQICTSFESRISLVAILTNRFLKVRCYREFKDKESQLRERITENIQSLSIPLQSFIKRLVGAEKFDTTLLDWCQETDTLTLTKGSLLHHLVSIVACCDFKKKTEMTFMQKLLCQPVDMKGCLIPSFLINTDDNFYDIREQELLKVQKTIRVCLRCNFMFICEREIEGKCFRCPSFAKEISNYSFHLTTMPIMNKSHGKNVFLTTTPSDNPFLTVRRLRPVAFRAINLIVHGCLAASIFSGCDADQTLSQLLGVDTPRKAMMLCLNQFEENLNVLAGLLNCSLQDVCLRLHLILAEESALFTNSKSITSYSECKKWEDEAQNVIIQILFRQPLISDNKFQFGLERNGLVAKLLETRFSNISWPEDVIMRLFRTTKPATCRNLSVHFFNLPGDTRRQFPFLSHILSNGDKLKCLRALYPMVEWAKFVRNTLEHTITREQLEARTISYFLNEMIGKDNKEHARKMYKAFENAWNELCRPFVDNYHSEVEIPRLNGQSSLSLCVVRKDDSPAYINQLFVLLQEVQNSFLHKALLTASSTDGPVARLLVDDKGVASLPLTNIENLRKSELIQFEWKDEYVRHSHSNTEYGHGTQTVYDLGKIEQELVVYVITGKAIFLSPEENFRPMIFANELFGEYGMVLRKISEIVPQDCLPKEALATMEAAYEHSPEHVRDFLADLELILCCLKNTGGSPDDSLFSYTEKWLSRFRRRREHVILIRNQEILCLKHVVALYEAVEDMSTNVDYLADCYRCKIDDESLEKINSMKPPDEYYSDNILLIAVRRLISRYLLGDGKKLPGEEPLGKHMADITLWPNFKGTRDELITRLHNLIPPQIMLKNTFQFYEAISNRLKVRFLTVLSAHGLTPIKNSYSRFTTLDDDVQPIKTLTSRCFDVSGFFQLLD